jgi:hypothetical protein
MEITENTFIDILGLPEWDERVIDLLEYLELERPIPKKGETDIFLKAEKYDIELFFDEIVTVPEQEKFAESGTLFLDQISFDMNTSLPLPFGITKEDNYQDIVEKIGKETDTPSKYIDNNCGWQLLNNDNIDYWFSVIFNNNCMDNDVSKIKEIVFRVQLP